MNGFSVLLNIEDVTIGKCCKNTVAKEVCISTTTQTVNLQNGYILNIISATSNSCTVLIQNGFQVIIRTIRSFPISICLPNKNCTQIVTLSCKTFTTP